MARLLLLAILLALPRPADACTPLSVLPGIEVQMNESFADDAGMVCTLVGIRVGAKTYPDVASATPAGLAHLGWKDPTKRAEIARQWIDSVYLPASNRELALRPFKLFAPLAIDTIDGKTRVRFWIDVTVFGGMQEPDNFSYVELELRFADNGTVAEKRLRSFEDPIDLPPSACSAKPFPGIEVRGVFVRNSGCTVQSVVIAGKKLTDHEAAWKAARVKLGWKTATLDQRKQIAMRWFEEVTGRFEHFHLVRTSPTWFGSEAFHPVTIDDTISISAWVDATRDDRVHAPIQHEFRDLVFQLDAAGELTRKTLRDVRI